MTELHEDLLSVWEPLSPPENFAERVLATQRARKTQKRWAAAAAIVLLLGASGYALRWHGAEPVDGELTAGVRTSLPLAKRAIVVAEKDAHLAWHVAASGAATIEQTTGRVFYRVEPGDSFVVSTPAGDVVVQGTCFTVDVDEKKNSEEASAMKGLILGGVLGAALSHVATVTVYEGKVSAQNAQGQLAVSAGEAAQMHSGMAPSSALLSTGPLSPAAVQVLLAEKRAAESDATAARLEVSSLKSQLADAANKAPVTSMRNAMAGGVIDPSPEQLQEMAKNCEVNVDMPSDLSGTPADMSDKTAAKYGLSPSERTSFDQATKTFGAAAGAQLAAFYTQVTGKPVDPAMTSHAMIEIISGTIGAQGAAARQHIAQQRAGIATTPSDWTQQSVADQYEHWFSGLGDAFEDAVGAQLGAARAHALRSVNNGWLGSRHSSSGCPSEE